MFFFFLISQAHQYLINSALAMLRGSCTSVRSRNTHLGLRTRFSYAGSRNPSSYRNEKCIFVCCCIFKFSTKFFCLPNLTQSDVKLFVVFMYLTVCEFSCASL